MNWPEQAAVVRVTAKNATNIRKAFDASMDGDEITAKWFETHPAGGSVSPQMARDWALAQVDVNKKPIELALSRIYADGYTLGQKVAKTRLLGLLVKDVSVGTVDWSRWTPGAESAAALVRPQGGLRQLLDSRRITIADDVIRTKLDRIGTSLSASLERGLGARETAAAINNIINDPQHALVIARTEMARSMSVATRDTYEKSDVKWVEWLVAEGCEDCQENADASPIGIDETFPTGDSEPPAHPNCMCALAPYFDDLELPEEEEAPVEDFPIDDILIEPELIEPELVEPGMAVPTYSSDDFQPVVGLEDTLDAMNQMAGYDAISSNNLEGAGALGTYQGNGYININNALRRPLAVIDENDAIYQAEITRNVVQTNIERLDKVMENSPGLKENTLTYRGVSGSEADRVFKFLKEGDSYIDPAYVSTSLDKTIPRDFLLNSSQKYILEIENPVGTKGVYPAVFKEGKLNRKLFNEGQNGEAEWLLPRNTKFSVLKVTEEDDGITYIRLRVNQAVEKPVAKPVEEPAVKPTSYAGRRNQAVQDTSENIFSYFKKQEPGPYADTEFITQTIDALPASVGPDMSEKEIDAVKALLRAEGKMKDYANRAEEVLVREGWSRRTAETQVAIEIRRVKNYVENISNTKRQQTKIAEYKVSPDPDYKQMYKEWEENAPQGKKKFEEVLKTGQPAIAVPKDIFESVLKEGRFKNQFETKTSGGTLDRGVRIEGEGVALNIDANVPGKQRPIYGYLSNGNTAAPSNTRDKQSLNQVWDRILSLNNPSVEQYGDIRIVLKPHMRDRATITTNDSLGAGQLADRLSSDSHDFVQIRAEENLYSVDNGGKPFTRYIELQYDKVGIEDFEAVYVPEQDLPYFKKLFQDMKLDIDVFARAGEG